MLAANRRALVTLTPKSGAYAKDSSQTRPTQQTHLAHQVPTERQGGTLPRIQVESTRVKCGFLSSRGTEHLQGVNHWGCWQGLVTLPVRIPMPLGGPVMLLDPRPGSLTGSSHATRPSFRCSSGSNVLAEKGLAGASAGTGTPPSRALHVLLVGTTCGPSPSVMPSRNRCSGVLRCPTRLCPSSHDETHTARVTERSRAKANAQESSPCTHHHRPPRHQSGGHAEGLRIGAQWPDSVL
jgi:hypothetical protein